MSQWPSSKAKRVYQALLRIGWTPKAQASGTSHIQLQRPGYRDYTWAWHDSQELGRAALRRLGKYTGLTPEDL
ncbi:MAG: type II toxin-antitoxin system HicA family toxin [Nitrospirales bacterium]